MIQRNSLFVLSLNEARIKCVTGASFILELNKREKQESMVLVKLAKYKECLDNLEKSVLFIRDSVKMNDIKIQCYKNLKNEEKMLATIEENIKLYPDDGDYFDIIEEFKKGEDYIQILLKYKDELQSKYAWVRALELIDVNDERYEPLLRSYLQPLIMKSAFF